MDLMEMFRKSRRQLNHGKELATARITSALSLNNVSRLDQRDPKGGTVLHLAAKHSKPQTVSLLLNQGCCKVSDKDVEGNTALHVAAESGNRDAARILLNNGAKISERNYQGFVPLHLAAKAGMTQVVNLFLQHPEINVDQKTSLGSRTALHLAAINGSETVVKALVAKGANPRCKASLGWTPLHFSARAGNGAVTRFLIQKGARVNSTTTGNWTPLMFAAKHNQIEVTRILIENGAETSRINRDGQDALAIAMAEGHRNMVFLLRGSPEPTAPISTPESSRVSMSPDTPRLYNPEVRRSAVGQGQDREEFIRRREPSDSENGELVELLGLNDPALEQIDDLNEEDSATIDKLRSLLTEKVAEIGKAREENLSTLQEKEREINDIGERLRLNKEEEDELRSRLEKVKKEGRDLTVKEAVVKNAFEKSSKHGEEKVRHLEAAALQIKSHIRMNLKRIKEERKRQEEERKFKHRRSKSNEQSINIAAELECPICFELSRPPIYQCPEGHIICNNCRPKVNRCPVCRFVFHDAPNIRNRFVERLSSAYFNDEHDAIDE